MSNSLSFAAVAGFAALGLALKAYLSPGSNEGEEKAPSRCPFSGTTGNPSKCPGGGSKTTNTKNASSTTKTTSTTVAAPEPESNVSVAENGEIKIQCPFTGKTYTVDPSKPARRSTICPRRGETPVHYHSYLALDQILTAQHPKSLEVSGELAHDEVLFIITHQTHELWFKQIIHDLSSLHELMAQTTIHERDMAKVIERLGRIVQIQRLLVDHLDVLETMTPLSFLEFREFLFPASGFQSMQFRRLEVALGLQRKNRHIYAGAQYDCALTPEQSLEIQEFEKEDSLFVLVDRWLARLPVLKVGNFDFWNEYKNAVRAMFKIDTEEVYNFCELGRFSVEVRNARLADIESQSAFFDSFFDEDQYETSRQKGVYRLSYRACQAALMINFYQEEPLFQVPFQLLNLLMEVDANLAAWRSKHAAMVHRMLGLKMGTGGSSGFAYLTETINQHKVRDLSAIITIIICVSLFYPFTLLCLLSFLFFLLDLP